MKQSQSAPQDKERLAHESIHMTRAPRMSNNGKKK